MIRRFHRLAPALLALVLVSCAASGPGSPPAPPPLEGSEPVSPIRTSMRPELRVFYDMLEGLGDWNLIEPYGYVFRPRVNFVAWRPYANGYWVPSDAWGWIWVSTDDFGWATDHYGRWMYDRFQGWVWVPDVQWAPAVVTWVGDADYVGWAPLLTTPSMYSQVPGGAYSYAPVTALASTDLPARLVPADALGAHRETLQPIGRTVERDGLTFNAGPRLDWVERRTGPLRRAQLQDLVPPGLLVRGTGGESRPRAPAPQDKPVLEGAAREFRDAAGAARDAVQSAAPPPERVPVVRPFVRTADGPRAEPGASRRPARRGAPADSTR